MMFVPCQQSSRRKAESRGESPKKQSSVLRASGRSTGQCDSVYTRGRPSVGVGAAASRGQAGPARGGHQGAAERGAAVARLRAGRRQLRSGSERRSLLGG